jgi:alpha-tubulin suppressor-like RCC1 family protein
VIAIAAGYQHTVALKTNGSVVAWGDNFAGETTVLVDAQSGVIAISAGGYQTVTLKADGRVVAWGYSYFGFDYVVKTTVPTKAQTGVTAIAAGYSHIVALLGTAVALNLTRSADELILSWPANATGFALQSTLQLIPPVDWVDVTNAAPHGTRWEVTNSFSGAAQFYRLIKP